MKPWLEEEPRNFSKKRPKRANNRPGEGMRVINNHVEEDYYDVDDLDDIEEINYNKTPYKRKQRSNDLI